METIKKMLQDISLWEAELKYLLEELYRTIMKQQFLMAELNAPFANIPLIDTSISIEEHIERAVKRDFDDIKARKKNYKHLLSGALLNEHRQVYSRLQELIDWIYLNEGIIKNYYSKASKTVNVSISDRIITLAKEMKLKSGSANIDLPDKRNKIFEQLQKEDIKTTKNYVSKVLSQYGFYGYKGVK